MTLASVAGLDYQNWPHPSALPIEVGVERLRRAQAGVPVLLGERLEGSARRTGLKTGHYNFRLVRFIFRRLRRTFGGRILLVTA